MSFMRALFISDLHLHENDVETNARFDAFVAGPAPHCDALYVLGDLFHVWLGDAMLPSDAYALSIVAKFRTLADAGVKIFIARGNRDFMLGPEFARQCGAVLLDEKTVVKLDDQSVLLLHGDELCTDDVRYQRVRKIFRMNTFRWIGNSLPTSWRHAIARRLRRESDAHKSMTSMSIMDANANAINAMFEKYDVTIMIHGHTHRPADRLVAKNRRRIVLSDWQQDYGFLEWSDGAFQVRQWHNKSTLGM
jgi:UDP-2,3-diacylglucosamine hydrolase